MAGPISLAERREVTAVVAERYRSASRREKGRILDELIATTGWHRKHAVRALRTKAQPVSEPKPRQRRHGAAIKDGLVALWEASDRVCGKRLKAMIPVLLPALVRPVRLAPTPEERAPHSGRGQRIDPARCEGMFHARSFAVIVWIKLESAMAGQQLTGRLLRGGPHARWNRNGRSVGSLGNAS